MDADNRPEARLWLVAYHLSLITVLPEAATRIISRQDAGPQSLSLRGGKRYLTPLILPRISYNAQRAGVYSVCVVTCPQARISYNRASARPSTVAVVTCPQARISYNA